MMKLSKTAVLLLCFTILLPFLCRAQNYQITGKVINTETQQALSGVNIFLDKTTFGTTTNQNGRYFLKDLPSGTYQLVFSFVGFQQVKKNIKIPRSYDAPINVSLKPRLLVMDSLLITDNRPDRWLRNLKVFKKRFLGYTKNSDDTEILNPEVLTFQRKAGDLVAHSEEPLKLRNEALGYKIDVYLNEFSIYGSYLRTDASSKFTRMEAESDRQRRRWEWERKRAYEGSFRHFIHALPKGNLFEEGFRILLTDHPRIYSHDNESADTYRGLQFFGRRDEVEVNDDQTDELWGYHKLGQIRLTSTKGYDYLKVVFMKERSERSLSRMMSTNFSINQVSFLKFPKGSALVDAKTALGIPPKPPVIYGYWAWSSNIPEWLPKNYKP